MIWPLGERWGWCDHWFAWALYSPHSSRTELWIAAEGVGDLAEDLKPWVEMREVQDQGRQWRRMRLDQWSLDALHAPLYPQARFQYGVARELIREQDLEANAVLRVLGTAKRIDGSREQLFFGSLREAKRWHDPFWLNADARLPIANGQVDAYLWEINLPSAD